MKVVIYNLGCKVNQYEGYSMGNILEKSGCEVCYDLSPADMYIINSCAVTKEAERKSSQTIAKIKKINSEAEIIVCGCASQKNPEHFSDKKVTFVFGTASKGEILNILGRKGCMLKELPLNYEDNLEQRTFRTRAYIKIQDGCDNFCSYCIVPFLRGRSRSRPIDSVLAEIARTGNCNEIVLTGINLSAYGRKEGYSLADLVDSLSGVDKRIRLGSLEVNVITRELLTSLKNLKMFCPHFHLSLQSGSDSVLKRMNRHYSVSEYAEKVELIRKFYPMAAVTTDIIAGFPEETEEEFAETLAFAEKIRFSAAHVFPYSVREGTAAAKMPQLPPEIKNERARLLSERTAVSENEYRKSFYGHTAEVLTEEFKSPYTIGHTREYLKVYIAEKIPHNILINVKIGDMYLDGVFGVPVTE